MSIEFGQVNHSQPEHELRPDRNAQFATTIVGEIGPTDLPIFVDLDVMRDMEAHSLTDTRVELGGVMLGRQRRRRSRQSVCGDSRKPESRTLPRDQRQFYLHA